MFFLQLGVTGGLEAIDDLVLGNSSLTGGSAGGDQADIGRGGPTVDVLPSTETGNPIDDIVHPPLKDKNENGRGESKGTIPGKLFLQLQSKSKVTGHPIDDSVHPQLKEKTRKLQKNHQYLYFIVIMTVVTRTTALWVRKVNVTADYQIMIIILQLAVLDQGDSSPLLKYNNSFWIKK